jgi:hypothetical protein
LSSLISNPAILQQKGASKDVAQVQVLKFESQYFSSLAVFLLKRASRSYGRVGQFFFWHLMVAPTFYF